MNTPDFSPLFQVPLQISDMMITHSQAWQEATVEYYHALEKIQRDSLNAWINIWSQALPGDTKLWEMHTQWLNAGFDALDKMAGKIS